MYKNIEKKKILELKNLVDYQEGQVVSKTLVQNELVSVTVFYLIKMKRFQLMQLEGMLW